MITETKRLYFEDPYLVEFEARVEESLIHEGLPAAVLDRTCFYPESGGQPADRGTINGVKVVHVVEEDSRIIHLLERPVPRGGAQGKVDWQRRFDHMQQHTGQHILSQSFHELLGGETLSFHLGEEASTVEIGLEEVDEDDMDKVEGRANGIVFENREVKNYFFPLDRIHEIPLRKSPQKEGLIRVVEVTGFDYSACGGTHCRRTGEVGLVKITRWEKIRNNVRFEFLCGERALKDFAIKCKTMRWLSTRLSTGERELAASVEKMVSESKSLKKMMRKLAERTARYEARDIVQSRPPEESVIKKVFTDKTPDEVKFLALNVIRAGECIALFGLKAEERSHLVFARSDSIELDMRELVPLVVSLTGAKGGGSSSLVEMVLEGGKDPGPALDRAFESVMGKSKI